LILRALHIPRKGGVDDEDQEGIEKGCNDL
jgi:hypothetical protein